MSTKGFVGEGNLQSGTEYLDIVTLNDRVRGITSYDDAHKYGHRHRVVHILVFKDYSLQDLLLPMRSRRKRLGGLCFHSSVAGHVRHGEDYWQAGYRESNEEIFYEFQGCPSRFKLSNDGITIRNDSDRGNNNELAKILTAVYPGPFQYNPEEVVERATGWENIHTIKKEMDDRIKRARYTSDFRNVFLMWYSGKRTYL